MLERNAPEPQLSIALLTLLHHLNENPKSTVGPIATRFRDVYAGTSEERHDAVRNQLIWLEEKGYAETVSRNPRRWRITAAGKDAITIHDE